MTCSAVSSGGRGVLITGRQHARHPEAAWVFIYTREAHPGENVLHHDGFERKLACAKLLAEEAGIGRDILVDDLDGTVHRAYRLMQHLLRNGPRAVAEFENAQQLWAGRAAT